MAATHPLPPLARGCALALAVALPAGAAAQAAGSARAGADAYRTVLERYCVTCHNERLQTGSLALDSVSLTDVGPHAAVWERVLRKLKTQAMPPPGRPRPDAATYDGFANWLAAALDRAAAEAPNPGRPTVHRLNRLEYANAIRDLLALGIDGASLLPGDDMAFGFDNNADILTMAPGLLARYLSAARKISRLAVGDPTIEADVVRYPVSSLLAQDDRMDEALPFGTRGGTAVRHHFPLSGEYVVTLGLQSGAGSGAIDVHLDGVRLGRLSVERQRGVIRGQPSVNAGEAIRVPVRAGMHTVGASFVKRPRVPEGIAPARLPLWTFMTGAGFARLPALESISIAGPYGPRTPGATASRQRIFVCRPDDPGDEPACARQILAKLARRGFRRATTPEDVQGLLAFYREGRRRGDFDAGIQRALESLLMDPEFLYRIERDPVGVAPATAYRLSNVELASRLSFFLWSSIPDDELLDRAVSGRLADPDELERQVRRMLSDERSRALVTSFASQWLHLRRMRSVTPDVNAFPTFDENLREAFVRETKLFLDSQIRGDRPMLELLTADYTFANERLARHYGMENVHGARFRRVALLDDARRGLLAHGSILTVTSLATRTSPVVRGKWVLENILGAPPPPPPPDVPELDEPDEPGAAPASLRARLEAHRASPVCANCHARLDPIGFAFENFDAIGHWRDMDGPTPIDASGTLPDGTTFDGLPELRGLLLARGDEVVAAVTEKLLTYALGRGIEPYDRPAIRAIVRESGPDHRWSSVILGVVRSLPFQMRRSES